jgi:predicted negative regulator of RcsB-dependent stress response
MSNHHGALIELLLVVGLLLGLAGWQWWDTRQWRRRQDEQRKLDQPQQPEKAGQDGPGE